MILVPAIDIINGQCVRLTKGDYDTKKVYSDSPLEVAKAFEGAGLTHLHVVDLDGARAKHIVNTKVLEAIATKTTLTVDFGGGIKSAVDLQTAFDCGAAQVTLGSIAVDAPELVLEWLQQFGVRQTHIGRRCQRQTNCHARMGKRLGHRRFGFCQRLHRKRL